MPVFSLRSYVWSEIYFFVFMITLAGILSFGGIELLWPRRIPLWFFGQVIYAAAVKPSLWSLKDALVHGEIRSASDMSTLLPILLPVLLSLASAAASFTFFGFQIAFLVSGSDGACETQGVCPNHTFTLIIVILLAAFLGFQALTFAAGILVAHWSKLFPTEGRRGRKGKRSSSSSKQSSDPLLLTETGR
jgi:hypothetical protein